MKEVIIKDQIVNDDFAFYCGDAVEISKGLPDNVADITIYSPPFWELYVYSDDSKDHEQFCKLHTI